MSKEFEIKREVVLEATPEAVFEAVTAGTGNWMFPVEMEAAADGVANDPKVRAWEPPNRFAVRVEGENGWFNALEYIVEARDGGTATLRYVHSGVFTDDWDNQYDGAAKHTDFYLHTLGQYLKYFSGRTAAYAAVSGPAASSGEKAMESVKQALGVTREGETIRLALPGLTPVEAVVDYLNPYFLGLRTTDALYRVFGRNHFGGTMDAAHHLFGGAGKDETEQAWRTLLDEVFAA
ncbi:SRPBCC domain-containing protein [Amycolatopsis cynarae]|uniref:SRPBCC domain-containing protein n=1 Tax=Amycolatopsis cynarae TaxID=2995223 RepID=A0ABY7B0S5_9PSEU|nr:SRPBCC domain-containing protein [Amycolatopsis sp. HUAS 11-8]WAL65034.1 SRPBCC domain-containing protein [Amycolatopsis sp. HUAS 11-8]